MNSDRGLDTFPLGSRCYNVVVFCALQESQQPQHLQGIPLHVGVDLLAFLQFSALGGMASKKDKFISIRCI